MKRYLILLLLLIASPSFAQWQEAKTSQGVMGAVAAGGDVTPPAIVNAWKDEDGGTGGTAAISVASTGNLLIAWLCTVAASDDATVSSSVNGSFTKIISETEATVGRGTMFYLKNVTTGAHTITYNGGTGSTFTNIFIYEVSGLSTTAPFTGGEYVTRVDATLSTNPYVTGLTNATATSIFFAGFVSGETGTSSIAINGSNTTPAGGWSAHANGESENATSVMHSGTAYYVASTSSSRGHGWTIGAAKKSVSVVIALHP